jgi:hypothetical protein
VPHKSRKTALKGNHNSKIAGKGCGRSGDTGGGWKSAARASVRPDGAVSGVKGAASVWLFGWSPYPDGVEPRVLISSPLSRG